MPLFSLLVISCATLGALICSCRPQVNYLSADPAVREHMESAIGTVLNFTPEDMDKVKKQKELSESWF